MVDWLSSMQQTYEFYEVDPNTWGNMRLLTNIMSCTIDRDNESTTLGSASIDCQGSMDECYIRVYLVTIQNGIKEKHPLGTFLVQTPSIEFDGKIYTNSLEAYTPLIELNETQPPIGYSLFKGDGILEHAAIICSEHMRAPTISVNNNTSKNATKNLSDDFVANTDDTWLTLVTSLLSYSQYELYLDEMGRTLFSPKQDISSLQPVWTYDDSNSSILCPDITDKRDLFGIPNVVEVVYSYGDNNDGNISYISRVENNDANSPTSIVNRGREILYRETSPSITGNPTHEQIDEYAKDVLRSMSSVEHTITYSHGYCPVRIGDCVRINYERAGLTDITAKVINQSIKCSSGCLVSETAIYTTKLWEG